MRNPKARGRPQIPNLLSNDAKRAFVLYAAAEHYRKDNGLRRNANLEFTTFKLIALAKSLYPCRGIFDRPVQRHKMLASIKRGRKILGIKDGWCGPKPQSLLNRRTSSIL
jgi:hypothetical protein